MILVYCIKQAANLRSFDANFADDKVTRKSTSEIPCKLGDAAIIWKSKKQHRGAQSTMEAEFVSAAKEIIWLTRLLNEISVKIIKMNYI